MQTQGLAQVRKSVYFLHMKENISFVQEAVTARQATELLPGMTYARLMRLAKLGKIPSIQYGAGARRFFLISDLVEYARASGFELDLVSGKSDARRDLPLPGLGGAGR